MFNMYGWMYVYVYVYAIPLHHVYVWTARILVEGV